MFTQQVETASAGFMDAHQDFWTIQCGIRDGLCSLVESEAQPMIKVEK
jgi:hypothetical protein